MTAKSALTQFERQLLETQELHQLCPRFKLTPAECRFAQAFLHRPSTVKVSHDLGVSVETTRHYLKVLFLKTGTKSQAQLVRRLLLTLIAGAVHE